MSTDTRDDVRIGVIPDNVIVIWSRAFRVCPGCGDVREPERECPAEPDEEHPEKGRPKASMIHQCGTWWGPVVYKTYKHDPSTGDLDLDVVGLLVRTTGAEYDEIVVNAS